MLALPIRFASSKAFLNVNVISESLSTIRIRLVNGDSSFFFSTCCGSFSCCSLCWGSVSSFNLVSFPCFYVSIVRLRVLLWPALVISWMISHHYLSFNIPFFYRVVHTTNINKVSYLHPILFSRILLCFFFGVEYMSTLLACSSSTLAKTTHIFIFIYPYPCMVHLYTRKSCLKVTSFVFY